MKKTIVLALLAVFAMSASAVTQDNKKENPNKPVFTVVKQTPIPPINNHNRAVNGGANSPLTYCTS